MKLAEAERLAEDLVRQMAPYCARIQVAGSIRRRKGLVGDIEILCIPRWEHRPDPSDLFGADRRVNTLHTDWGERCGMQWLKGFKPEGKYWRGLLKDQCQVVDVFLVTPESWGLQLVIRTGCAEFSQAFVTHARDIGRPSEGGYLRGCDGSPLPTREEEDAFALVGLAWVDPEQRTGRQALRRTGRYADPLTLAGGVK